VALDDSVQARGNLFATLLKNPAHCEGIGDFVSQIRSIRRAPRPLGSVDGDAAA